MAKPWKSRPQNLPRPDHTRVPHLPGAIFLDEKAFADCEPEAADYEAIVAAYALDGCVADLWDGLQQLSTFDNDEIEWHLANPGKRMEQAYISG
ncbi:MAG: hypothetical protein WCD52_04250 [Xanthobacteraceae bacterium]